MLFLMYFIFGFLILVLGVTLFNFLTAPMLKNGPRPTAFPLVSLLVPARNEAANIRNCLDSLRQQDYPQLEIHVLDDQSTDTTAAIVQSVAAADPRVFYHAGAALPPGWTGKNWACHQLSQYARGDILIFTDADNRHAPDAVSKTVGWMQKLGLGLFSAFPQQYTYTLAEKLVVPSVYMTVHCYLPLWLTYHVPFPSLAAANGQWIAFTRECYNHINGHQAARNQVVEDTWLARHAKQQGHKILTAAGADAVFSRMYHNASEVWQGFSKNLFGLMSYQTLPFLLLLMLMLLGYVAPYALVFVPPLTLYAAGAILLNLLIRGMLALKYGDPWLSVLLHPVGILWTIIIGLNSMAVYRNGNLTWKGRQLWGRNP